MCLGGHHLAWDKWRLFGAELAVALLLALIAAASTGGAGQGALGAAVRGETLPFLAAGLWLELGLILATVWLALYAADLFDMGVARRDMGGGLRLLLSLGAGVLLL